jgi:hypothetical protein
MPALTIEMMSDCVSGEGGGCRFVAQPIARTASVKRMNAVFIPGRMYDKTPLKPTPAYESAE